MTARARSYGGRSADERAASRRSSLVAATVALLATEGAARTTMTAICAEAGLTERYFYESFASRDDALLAALDAVSDEIAGTALTAIEATSGDSASRVRAAIGAFVDLVVRSPGTGRVAVVEANANAVLRARRHELLGVFASLAAREAAQLFGDDAWPAPRDQVQGVLFIAGVSELVASWLLEEIELEPDELVAATSDAFVALLRRS